MIGVAAADVLRWLNVALGLALAGLAGFAIVVSAYWDQRVRFAVFASFGVLLTAGHLSSLGRDGSYRLPILAAVLICAVVSTVAYVHREGALWRARRTMNYHAGGARDAGAGHVPIPGPGPAPRSPGHLGRGPGAPVGDHAAPVAPTGEGDPGVGGTLLPPGDDADRPGGGRPGPSGTAGAWE